MFGWGSFLGVVATTLIVETRFGSDVPELLPSTLAVTIFKSSAICIGRIRSFILSPFTLAMFSNVTCQQIIGNTQNFVQKQHVIIDIMRIAYS